MAQRIYLGVSAALITCVIISGCHVGWLCEAPYPFDDQLYGAILPSEREIKSYPKAISPRAFESPASPSALTSSMPAATQLSNTPPIGQQGPCSFCTSQGSPGSCVAWSYGYGMGSYTANLTQNWGINTTDHQNSPAFLYEFALHEESRTCPTGTMSISYLKYMVTYGGVSLATAPYTATCSALGDGDLGDQPDPRFKIGSWVHIDPKNRNLIKEHLAAGRAVAFVGHLYDGFGDLTGSAVFYGSGPFEVNKHTGMLVGHGMMLIGYDDNLGDASKGLGAYRIQNSFGTSWGDNGYLWMSYDTFENSILATASAEPLESVLPSIADLASTEPTAPPARLTKAFQWADIENDGSARVYLVLKHQFDAAVEIRTIALTDPSGATARHRYDVWHNNGYTHLSRTDGSQFLAGIYHVEIHAGLADGSETEYASDVNIDALPNSSLPAKKFVRGVLGGNGEPAHVR